MPRVTRTRAELGLQDLQPLMPDLPSLMDTPVSIVFPTDLIQTNATWIGEDLDETNLPIHLPFSGVNAAQESVPLITKKGDRILVYEPPNPYSCHYNSEILFNTSDHLVQIKKDVRLIAFTYSHMCVYP